MKDMKNTCCKNVSSENSHKSDPSGYWSLIKSHIKFHFEIGFDLKIIKAGGYLLSFIRNKVN